MRIHHFNRSQVALLAVIAVTGMLLVLTGCTRSPDGVSQSSEPGEAEEVITPELLERYNRTTQVTVDHPEVFGGADIIDGAIVVYAPDVQLARETYEKAGQGGYLDEVELRTSTATAEQMDEVQDRVFEYAQRKPHPFQLTALGNEVVGDQSTVAVGATSDTQPEVIDQLRSMSTELVEVVVTENDDVNDAA